MNLSEKAERIDDLRNRLYRMLDSRTNVTDELKRIVHEIFDKILNLYEENFCNTDLIKLYIEDFTKQEISNFLNKFDSEKKNSNLVELADIINILNVNLDYDKDITQTDIQEQIRIDSSSILRDTRNILDYLKEQLYDVRNRQSRYLDSRGYKNDRILSISDTIRAFIDSLSSYEEKIYEVLEKDRKNLITSVNNLYEEFRIEIKQSDKLSQESKYSNRSYFKKQLDAGISLDDQHEFANKLQNEKENSESSFAEALPTHVID